MEAPNAKRTGSALEAMYRFMLWLIPTVEKFPRSQKFLLGDRIQATALDVVERLVEATYTRARRDKLLAANLGIEKLRLLFRLATEMHYLVTKRYEHAARSLDDVGRLVGGGRCPSGMTICFHRSLLSPPSSRQRGARCVASGASPAPPLSWRGSRRSASGSNATCSPAAGSPVVTSRSASRDPKLRTVSAAPFRDRVVHHALCAVIEPLFERGFVFDSYANRVGKGTHRALERYERYRDRHRFVLRGDIYRYFPAIDHAILRRDLRRRIACPATLDLCDWIIDGLNPQEPVEIYYPGDDLLTPFERQRGLPIGNLTSQFFANVYLDSLDHFAKEVLHAPYLRYVDDFALFDDDPEILAEWHQRVAAHLARRRLSLHPHKTQIVSTEAPATFLGFVLLPGGRRLPEENVRRFRNRLRDRYHAGSVDLDRAMRHIRSWVAHAAHADSWRLREAVFRDAVFDPSRRPGRSPAASSAAAPGTTTHGICARPTATTTHRTTETTISASGLPRHPAAGAGVFTETPGAQGCVQDRS